MTEEERVKFDDWKKQLMVEMDALADKVAKNVGAIIDSAIPFRLGWTPLRAAKALLCIHFGDNQTLVKLSLGDDKKW